MINIYAAWGGFFLGCCAGAIPGLFFHQQDWLGGYASWQRRLIRLAHISFFGLGFLNLAFGLTSQLLNLKSGVVIPSTLLLLGAVTMPLACYLSAWRPGLRYSMFIPASAVTLGTGVFLLSIV